MNTEKIEKLINESDSLKKMEKNVLLGFVLRSKERADKDTEDRELIEKVAREKRSFEIVISTEDIKIYKVAPSKDEWDAKFPFRSIFVKPKSVIWERCDTVAPTLDLALLNCLGKKHGSSNSQFADFAAKMLDIIIEE